MKLGNCMFSLAALSMAAALFLPAAQAQVLRKGKQADTPKANPTTPATPAPGETAGQTRREGRDEARDARQDTRAVGEGRQDAREAARDTRQDTRQNVQGSRQNTQASRAADLGVWFNSRGNQGLVISDLENQSLFSTAGFREGDVIVSVNGQPVTAEAQFMQFLVGPNVGTQPIQVIVLRNNQQQTLVLQPTALNQGVVAYDPLYQYGIVIDDRTPNQIVILRVYPRTPAYYAGLRTGDVITTIGGQRITSVNAFTQALTRADAAIDLQVNRGGRSRDLQLDASLDSDSSVRTAQRPNLDADARAPARAPDSDAVAPRAPDSSRVPARTPDSGAPRSEAPARAGQPNSPVAAPPAAPRTSPDTSGDRAPSAPRANPAAPAAPRANPATPAAPRAPAAPATPATPATPPAAPAAPR